MRASILGIGAVSALGAGLESLRAGLAGSVHPTIEAQAIEVASGSVSLPVYRARLDGLERFVRPRALRRLDRLSRMALYAAHLALEDGGGFDAIPQRRGLVFGTGHGPQATTFAFQDGLLEDGDRLASPTLFSGSVHNSLASQVSIALDLEGPCQTVTTLDRTTAEVLSTARAWLASGEVDQVLAGVGDELSPLLCYSVAGAGDGCGCKPGEGFVCWLLGNEQATAEHGWIESIEVGREVAVAPDRQALFLAATGDRNRASGAPRLLDRTEDTSAHAELYGDLPVGLGFEIALAALCPELGRIACVEYGNDGPRSCVVVAP